MCDNSNEPGSQYPGVEMSMKKLGKNKSLDKVRFVCESDSVVRDYWLEGGKLMERHQKLSKSFASRLGPVKIERTYCRCRDCGSGFFPMDCALGLEQQTVTPGAANLVADAVVSDSFEEASRKPNNSAG